MVFAAFNNPSDAEIALNNLYEADYDPASISLIMKDKDSVSKIADVKGFLTGAFNTKLLTKLKFKNSDMNAYQKVIQSDGALIAVDAGDDTDASAKEILEDQNAKFIKILNTP